MRSYRLTPFEPQAVLVVLPLALFAACNDQGEPSADSSMLEGGCTASAQPLVCLMDAQVGDPGSPLLGGDHDVVVDARFVQANLDALTLVDVRGRDAYEQARLPGAVWLDASRLRTNVGGIGGQVVSAEMFAAAVREAGIPSDTDVVFVGAATDTNVARVVWTFEYFGYDRVALLDGGYGAWSGQTDDSDAVAATPSDYLTATVDTERLVDADWVLESLENEDVALVDARSNSEYSAGHIPGAVSVDWNTLVSGGALLDEATLRSRFESVKAKETHVSYCQTGARASVDYVVMRYLGFRDVRLYDGSWAEWGARDDLPKE